MKILFGCGIDHVDRYRAEAVKELKMSTQEPRICGACAEFGISPAVMEPHDLMIRQPHSDQTPDSHLIEQYRCLECETAWSLRPTQDGLNGRMIKWPAITPLGGIGASQPYAATGCRRTLSGSWLAAASSRIIFA